MKSKYSLVLLGALPLFGGSGTWGADDLKAIRSAPEPTVVSLLQNANNAVQLGAQIDGQFSYPFTFASDPSPTNGLKISSTGLISGTPSDASDQILRITITDNDRKLVASYPVVLHIANTLTVMLGRTSNTGAATTSDPKAPLASPEGKIVIDPVYAGGDTITGDSGSPNSIVSVSCQHEAEKGKNEIPSCAAKYEGRVKSNDQGLFSFQFGTPLFRDDAISVSSAAGVIQKRIVQPTPRFLGEEMRAIVGYQQAGASSSDFEQNWFIDFYISRPLSFHPDKEGSDVKWRWWGNVRVASFPQPGNQSVAELASDLPSQIGALKLNQLAQGAEYLSGIEFKPWRSFPFRGFSENTRQVFSLGLIAGAGATGFFRSPSKDVKVFEVPAAGSPQLATFQRAFPTITTANVGFISPDIQRFPKQYLAGVRLTTHYIEPSGRPLTSAPAMLGLTVGQNQVITGGQLRGLVGRVEAFYPMPFGNRGQTIAGAFSSLYLFGTAQMRLGGTRTAPALVLKPSSLDATDPSVTLAPLPNTRDEYRIGFGIDMVNLISALTGGSAKKASGTKPKSPPPAPGAGEAGNP